MTRTSTAIALLLVCACLTVVAGAGEEGTRHVTGDKVDLYFMNDKVFGTVGGHPLWAIYNCGLDINGEMDLGGPYRKFGFEYKTDSAKRIEGKFGEQAMSLGAIDKTETGFTYHVFVGETEYTYSIRYEKFEDEHLMNSIIEGKLPGGKDLKLTVDGRLCPFATTGIILISAGAALAS